MTTSHTATISRHEPIFSFKRKSLQSLPTWSWLVSGIVITALSGMRFNVALLGWIAGVPWLMYLRSQQGRWRWILFLLALQLGTFLQVGKIVTEPISWLMVPLFSVPMALGAGVTYLGFEWMRRRLGDIWGIALFAALATVLEWTSWTTSELGSWGSAVYTQIDNTALLQICSLFGLGAPSLLIAAVSATVAVLIASAQPRLVTSKSPAATPQGSAQDGEGATFNLRGLRTSPWLAAGVVALLVAAAHIYGSFRMYQEQPGPMVKVAAIVSDIGMGPGGLPDEKVLRKGTDDLFARSEQAAKAGAKVIAWNEGATAIDPEKQEKFLARAQRLSSEFQVDLVVAYVVPLDGMKRFENKYVWLTPESEAQTYFKHHPVPGEGSVRGDAPITVLDRPYGKVAGAICYDYDFPDLARKHATQGAGLVVVPSSDWRGIDPYHTQMARVRGIEGGFSILRPVRWATSAAYDAFGRTRATMSWFENNDRIMMAQVPTGHVETLYSHVGDILPMACLAFALGSLAVAWRRRQLLISKLPSQSMTELGS